MEVDNDQQIAIKAAVHHLNSNNDQQKATEADLYTITSQCVT